MTKRNLIQKTAQFQKLFNLLHYKIEVGFDRESEDIGGSASIEIMHDYRRAIIHYASNEYKDWDEKKAIEIVCHELVHVILHPIEMIGLQAAEEGMSKSACNVIKAWMRHENEGAVEQITDAFLEALKA